jgi:nucleotide-binding universal stress UspA family protein
MNSNDEALLVRFGALRCAVRVAAELPLVEYADAARRLREERLRVFRAMSPELQKTALADELLAEISARAEAQRRTVSESVRPARSSRLRREA